MSFSASSESYIVLPYLNAFRMVNHRPYLPQKHWTSVAVKLVYTREMYHKKVTWAVFGAEMLLICRAPCTVGMEFELCKQ